MEAYIVDAVRTAGGKRGGALRDWHPADLARPVLDALVERTGIDRRGHRRRDHGLRRPDRRAGLPHRPQHGAGLEASRQRSGRHHRPPVRILAAVDPLRRPGGDERHPGRGHRRRRRSMTRVPMGTPVILPMQAGIGTGPLPQSIQDRFGVTDVQPVHRRRDDRREIRLQPRGARRLRARQPPQGRRARPRPARSTTEIVPLRGQRRHAIAPTRAFATTRRSKASARSRLLRGDGVITAANASQICDGASGVLVVSERALKAHGLTPLARIDQPDRHRRRSGDHARGADPRHARGARTLRHEHRRHRPLRGQRGLRAGPARLAAARSAPTRRGSTSTAARSRSATRSAPPAPS